MLDLDELRESPAQALRLLKLSVHHPPPELLERSRRGSIGSHGCQGSHAASQPPVGVRQGLERSTRDVGS